MLFVFSVLKFLVVFTLEKNVSKSKVYPPGHAKENREAPPLQNSV